LNSTDRTFGSLTTASIMVKRTAGNSFATVSTATPWLKPTAMMRSYPRWAKRRCALLDLRFVGDLELGGSDAGFLFEALGAIGYAFVEGLVELAARIEDDQGFDISRFDQSCGQQHRTESGGSGNGHYGLLLRLVDLARRLARN